MKPSEYDKEFDAFWLRLMHGLTKSCFERNVLRACKQELKASFSKLAEEWEDESNAKP